MQVQITKYINEYGCSSYQINLDNKRIITRVIYYKINDTLRAYGYAEFCNPMYDNCAAMVQYPIGE